MTSFEDLRLFDYSDDEMLRYIKSAERLLPNEMICRVKALSSTFVAKLVYKDELAGIEMAESLGIRVPPIRRVIPHENRFYMVTDRISGTTLDDAWMKLGWVSTISAAFQLRKFVKAMRSRTSPVAGALATGVCNSIWLDDFYGLPPHATPEVITSYIAFWLQYSRSQRKVYPNPNPTDMHLLPSEAPSFVFTHQDLAPRNMMLDKNGKLWLVDWGYSGWYPVYFEYVGMMNFTSVWNFMARIRWRLFCWISVGIYRKEYRAMELVRGNSVGDSCARQVIGGLWSYKFNTFL